MKHRQGHHVTFQSSLKKPAIDHKNLGVDDVSIMSSSSQSSTMKDFLAKKREESPAKVPDVELDLPSDGASTFRDFDPRDVRHLNDQIKMRDRDKQARIDFKTGDLQFGDSDIKPLLSLVP